MSTRPRWFGCICKESVLNAPLLGTPVSHAFWDLGPLSCLSPLWKEGLPTLGLKKGLLNCGLLKLQPWCLPSVWSLVLDWEPQKE